MGNSKNFKSLLIKISESDKKDAAKVLIDQGRKPTLRNIRLLLREWAIRGIIQKRVVN